LGEKTALLKFLTDKKRFYDFLNRIEKPPDFSNIPENDIEGRYYHAFRHPFIDATRDQIEKSFNVERKTHERFIVMMQASGNCSLAFFISVILILCGILFSNNIADKLLSLLIVVTTLCLIYLLKTEVAWTFPIYKVAVLLTLIFLIYISSTFLFQALFSYTQSIIIIYVFLVMGSTLYEGHLLHLERLYKWEIEIINSKDKPNF
jgi:hypothetical protein